MRKEIEFLSDLPDGFEIAICGQDYRFVRRISHTRRDGVPTTLMVWQAQCAECGKPFETKSPGNKCPDARRCHEHAKPGVKVRAQ